jgi:homoserine acetyltransferase
MPATSGCSAAKRLRDCKLAYKTFGKMNPARDNIIVYPTWYSGQHYDNEWLIGPGMALDPDKYFIIIPNMIGNGLSSSPSNMPAPYNGARFPRVTACDNVRLQHRLVTEKFFVKRLALVTGWSMGAWQTFHWGALYPDMVERIAPFCGSAKCSRHNFVFLEGVKAALTCDVAYNGAGTRNSPPGACGRWRASTPAGGFRKPSIANGSTSSAWAIRRSRISWSPSGRASFCPGRQQSPDHAVDLAERRHQRQRAL